MKRRTKKRLALVAIVLVALPIAGLSARALILLRRDRLLDSARAEGMAAAERGDHVATLDRLGFYVSRRLDDGEPLLAYAVAVEQSPQPNNRHISRAINANRLAATALPGDPRPLQNLVRLYPRIGFVRETIDAADALLAIQPGDQEALRAKAMSLLRVGRAAEARTVAESLLESAPADPWALGFILEARLASGEPATAVQQWMQSIAEKRPDDVDVLLVLARAEALAGQIDLAAATLRVAATKPIADDAQFRRLLMTLDAAGLAAESERLLESATTAEFATIGVERAWKQGRRAAALARAQAALAADDSPPTDLLAFAAILSAETDSADASIAALQARAGAAAAEWRTVLDAHSAIIKGEMSRARELLSPMTEATPDADTLTVRAVAEFFLAGVHSALGNHADAVAGWRTLVQFDPSWTLAGAALVEELSRAGRLDEAYIQAVGLLIRSPNNPIGARAYLMSASELINSGAALPGDPASLETATQLLRQASGNDPDMLALVAHLQIALNDPEGARATLKALKSLDARPAPNALIRLAGASQLAPADVQAAVADLTSELDPANPGFVFARAIAAGKAGRLEEGLQILNEAIAKSPDDGRLPLELARARFLRSIDQAKALDAMRALAEREPANAMLQSELLSLPLAWRDCKVVEDALRRLALVVGKDAANWRTFEARRLLECDRSQASASAALLSLSSLIAADPRSVEPTLLAADANIALGDPAGAAKALSSYLNAGGRDPRVHIRLIPILRDQGRWEDATRIAEALARVDPIPAAMLLPVGAVLEQWGFSVDARRMYLAAAEAGDPRAQMALIAFGLRSGDVKTARDAVERLRLDPNPTLDAYEAIATYQAMHEKDAAAARATIMDAPIEASQDRRAMALARALTLGKFPDEARAALEERTAADAGPEVWTDLIGLDMNGMDLQRADRNLQLALKAHPEDARLQMLRSVLDLAMGKGDSAAALAQINQALKDADASPELRELGEILSRHGSPGADRAEFTRELAILTTRRPTFFTAWRLLISAYMEDGRVIEAAAAGRAAAAAMPNDPRTLRLATEAIAGARLFPEALSTAESWRRVARDDRAEASLAVAQLRATLGQPEEGLIILEPMREAIIAQAEANPQMLTTYAGLLAATGRSREADALLRDSAGADASWALRYITIAEAMTGRPSDARAWLDQCAALVERRAEAAAPLGAQWRALAAATEEPADFAQAARWLSKAVQERPTALTLVALADCQAAAGDATGAEASYRQALTLREDPIAMNNFAGLLAKVRPGDDEARRLATRAIALARAAKVPPDSLARFIDTLGFAELRAGRHAEAIAAFDEALTLDPLLAESAVGKAEALLGKGDKAGAEASLRSLGEKNLRLSRDLAERVQAIRDSLTAGRI